MKYSLNDLENEAKEWCERLACDLEEAFEYEVPRPVFKQTSFFQVELPLAYSFATDGVWPFEGAIDVAGFETVEVIGEYFHKSSDRFLYPCMRDLSEQLSARQTLFDGDDLTIPEVARLANVDERTVRNATAAKKLTIKKVGGNTYITAHVAEKWLEERKGYRPTTFLFEEEGGSLLYQIIFKTLEEKKISIKDALRSAGLDVKLSKKYEKLKEDISIQFSNTDLYLLALALDLDSMHFIKIQTESEIKKGDI